MKKQIAMIQIGEKIDIRSSIPTVFSKGDLPESLGANQSIR